MSKRPIVLALALLAVGGCTAASVPWQHAEIPKDEWRRDYVQCKRFAEDQVGYREEDSSSPFRDYDRGRAKKQTDGYLNMCMRDLGYVPAKKGS